MSRRSDEYDFENISSCTVSYTAFPMQTELHFQPTVFNSYKISNRLQFISSLFFWKLFETVAFTELLYDVQHIQKMFKYIKTDTDIFYGP